MERYKSIIAYDGTTFSGMQRQADARTVQGEIENALKKIGWPGQTIYAAGRTDAGVHASGQVIAFDMDWQHPSSDLLRALNAALPMDIAARSLDKVRRDFHPRYDATARRYSYQILFDPLRNPLQERYVWRIWPGLDPDLLREVAALFTGTFDFSAFGKPPKAGGSTIRNVFRSEWDFHETGAIFTIEANAFLFRMVRRIVKAQVDAAAGKLSKKDIKHLLSGHGIGMIQGLAPAEGLTLVAVSYQPTQEINY